MHGFFGSYGKQVSFNLDSLPNGLVQRTFIGSDFCVEQRTLNQFLKDKWFEDSQDFFIGIEGVLFDAPTPQQLYATFRKEGIACLKHLRGTFSGILFDKQSQICYLWNDQIGSKMLFYSQQDKHVLFASDFWILAQHVVPDLSEQAMYSMLCYGFLPTHQTLVSSIHRIGAGECLQITPQGCSLKTYHRFSNQPSLDTTEQNIKNIDRLFRQAVQRVTDKNKAYRLTNFFPLSGGLDSRMAVWIANQLTQGQVHTFTYSQSQFYDHLLPQQIAQTLHLPWQFVPLDGGEYLKAIDAVTHLCDGQINYAGGPAQIAYTLPRYTLPDLGIIATGVNGDSVLSSDLAKPYSPYTLGEKSVSGYLYKELQSLIPDDFLQRYANDEIYSVYAQGFDCNGLGSPLMLQRWSETYSPFTDVDFLEYVLSIPVSRRRHYRLYDQWIKKCYPEVAQWHHKYETIGHRPIYINLMGRVIPLKDVIKREIWFILKHLHIHDCYTQKQGQSMNPIDSWLITNPSLRQTWNQYFEEHISLLSQYPTLRQHVTEQFHKGSAMAQTTALTLLACLQALHR